MVDRLDAIAMRKVGEKTYFNKIGVAFPAKDGEGWNVMLEAIPVPNDGAFRFILRPPKQRSDSAPPSNDSPF